MKNAKKTHKQYSQDNYNSPFATKFRELMIKHKVTQQTIADEIGGTRQVISQYMNGLVSPQIDKLVKIANFFDISCDCLLGRTDVESLNEDIQATCKFTGLSQDAVQSLNESKEFFSKEDTLPVMDILNKLLVHKNLTTLLADICKCEINVNKVEEEINRTEKLSSKDIKAIKLRELFKESLDVETMGEYYITPRKHLEISLYLLQKEFIEIIEDIINSKNVIEKFDEIYNK